MQTKDAWMHVCANWGKRPGSERLSRSPFCLFEIVSGRQDDLFVRTRVTIKTRNFRITSKRRSISQHSSSIAMKITLKKIPKLVCQPASALQFDAYPSLFSESYTGPQGFEELMSFSVRAADIVEFSAMSDRLGWADVYVFHTDFNSTALGPDQWEALEEDEIRIVSLGKKDICNLTRSGLVCHFLWMCACTDTTVGWERMSFYKVALAIAGMTFLMPVESWIECGEVDVVGMEVDESQFVKLTDFCAAFCIEKTIPISNPAQPLWSSWIAR